MVYKHTDINRHHMHIVALRVRTDGSCVTDKNNFYRSKEITRGLERKYGLKTAEREKVTPDTPLLKIDPSGDLKKQVAAAVKIIGMRYRFKTIGEYNAVLRLFNIRCEQTDGRVNGREYHGLVYFALGDDGKPIATPFKASRLGKFAGREAIEGKCEKAKEKINVTPTKERVADALAHCSGKDDFIARLEEKNIDVVFRYTDDGRIYGVTFIDHDTFNVLNGSRLGKTFSANALEAKFNPSQEPDSHQEHTVPVTQPSGQEPRQEPRQESEGNNGSGPDSSTQQQPHPAASQKSLFDDFDDNSIPGLDLFQQGKSYNPDEEAFIRRMKRQHRRGRKH